MVRQEKGPNFSECLYNVTSVTSNITLRFSLLAIGPNFGSSNSIGSLKGQSEMTLSGMLSDPNNAVKQFGSDFNKIVALSTTLSTTTCLNYA